MLWLCPYSQLGSFPRDTNSLQRKEMVASWDWSHWAHTLIVRAMFQSENPLHLHSNSMRHHHLTRILSTVEDTKAQSGLPVTVTRWSAQGGRLPAKSSNSASQSVVHTPVPGRGLFVMVPFQIATERKSSENFIEMCHRVILLLLKSNHFLNGACTGFLF